MNWYKLIHYTVSAYRTFARQSIYYATSALDVLRYKSIRFAASTNDIHILQIKLFCNVFVTMRWCELMHYETGATNVLWYKSTNFAACSSDAYQSIMLRACSCITMQINALCYKCVSMCCAKHYCVLLRTYEISGQLMHIANLIYASHQRTCVLQNHANPQHIIPLWLTHRVWNITQGRYDVMTHSLLRFHDTPHSCIGGKCSASTHCNTANADKHRTVHSPNMRESAHNNLRSPPASVTCWAL